MLISIASFSQEIALVKYMVVGIGMPILIASNLIKYCNSNINTHINFKPATSSPEVQPFFLSLPSYDRSWNVVFNESEVNNLNKYLVSGGSFTLTTITEWTSTLERNKENIPK
jgi:hypothetical protein